MGHVFDSRYKNNSGTNGLSTAAWNAVGWPADTKVPPCPLLLNQSSCSTQKRNSAGTTDRQQTPSSTRYYCSQHAEPSHPNFPRDKQM